MVVRDTVEVERGEMETAVVMAVVGTAMAAAATVKADCEGSPRARQVAEGMAEAAATEAASAAAVRVWAAAAAVLEERAAEEEKEGSMEVVGGEGFGRVGTAGNWVVTVESAGAGAMVDARVVAACLAACLAAAALREAAGCIRLEAPVVEGVAQPERNTAVVVGMEEGLRKPAVMARDSRRGSKVILRSCSCRTATRCDSRSHSPCDGFDTREAQLWTVHGMRVGMAQRA